MCSVNYDQLMVGFFERKSYAMNFSCEKNVDRMVAIRGSQ